MAQNLQETVREDPEFVTLVFELFMLSRRNEDIAAEYRGLMRRMRAHLAAMLALAQREGSPPPARGARGRRRVLFSLADGLALRMLAEPERDYRCDVRAGIVAVRALLTD